MDLVPLAKKARLAANQTATADTSTKNLFLQLAAKLLREQADAILAANADDLAQAEANGISGALLDRLALTNERVAGMANSMEAVAALPDPVGVSEDFHTRPNGLRVGRQRIPLGVIGMIYEARPNVTCEAAALCVKSGNVVLLKGGSEAHRSNMILGRVLQDALSQAGLPVDSVQVIPSTDRSVVLDLIQMDQYVDLVIPRGGEGLIRFVTENARVPVVQHYKGNCHVYVHEDADLTKAREITVNAKTHRPGVCNAAETLLIDATIAEAFLPDVAAELKSHGVQIRGCPSTVKIVDHAIPATDEDWDTEFLDLILAVRVVLGLDEALAHIQKHTSLHTEAIITENEAVSARFIKSVDSSCVLVNASTRFNDGFELGLGAEIGISTTKLHAFGPMGLEELTAKKFVVMGEGHIRA